MPDLIFRRVLTVLLAALVAACGSAPEVEQVPKPIVKTIAIVPPASPRSYSLQNLSAVQFLVPIAALGYGIHSSQRQAELNSKLPDPTFRLDETLANAVADRLRDNGYEVTILNNVERDPESPDSLKLELSDLETSADAVVHLYFEAVGVESPRRTTDYLPRISANVATFVRSNSSYPYYATVYYGVDATQPSHYHIPQESRHTYSNFAALIDNIENVREHFRQGTITVGNRIADRVHLALN
jgi:hypothetical protein